MVKQRYYVHHHGSLIKTSSRDLNSDLAKAGRKYELSKSEPKVGFEIDGKYKLLESETACDFSAAFQSVIGTGTLNLVDEKEEKKLGLNTIMKQTTKQTNWNYQNGMLEAVAVFRLDVDKMSCKAK